MKYWITIEGSQYYLKTKQPLTQSFFDRKKYDLVRVKKCSKNSKHSDNMFQYVHYLELCDAYKLVRTV